MRVFIQIIRLVPLQVDIDCDDTLNIYEKKNGRKKKLIESMCGRHVTATDDQEASVIRTTTNVMIIEFISGTKGRAFGFKLHYSSIGEYSVERYVCFMFDNCYGPIPYRVVSCVVGCQNSSHDRDVMLVVRRTSLISIVLCYSFS